MLFSGRRKAQVAEPARLLGCRAYIYEAGSALVLDGEEELLTGDLVPRDGLSIHDQIGSSGAPGLLLEHYAGRLEYHEPWHRDREVSHLFRGAIDALEADALLLERGHGDLRLVDNGAIAARMSGVEQARAYHLIPRVASKARAVARHMQARGYEPEETIAIGDSREDLGAAAAVGTFWLVANALERDPSIAWRRRRANVRVAEERNGDGRLRGRDHGARGAPLASSGGRTRRSSRRPHQQQQRPAGEDRRDLALDRLEDSRVPRLA